MILLGTRAECSGDKTKMEKEKGPGILLGHVVSRKLLVEKV